MKIIEQVKLQEDIEVPWRVWTKFGQSAKCITVMGKHVSLTDQGDFGTIEELREAIEFYVDQLGGTVKWSKK
jgi:hypothetical protein